MESFKQKKIALLFLIYDEINQEEVWYEWLKNIDTHLYSVYIHYKSDKELKYFNKYKVKNCVETEWGELSIVKAQDVLLGNALRDPCNTNFIFLSNSCIPLKSFTYVYNFLSQNASYFNIDSKNEAFLRYNKLKNFIDESSIQKSHQWCILSRKHAEILFVHRSVYYNWYDGVFCPDESAYITYLYNNKNQDELILTFGSADNATTFTNWRNETYKFYNNGKCLKHSSPNTYLEICKEEIEHLVKDSKCLFGRKFHSSCDLSYLTSLIKE